MYTNNRDAYRQTFFDVWSKYQSQQLLNPLESQLLNIIIQHPEYHTVLMETELSINKEYAIDDNPFLHMSLHLAIQEQIHTNRPAGITVQYQNLMAKYQDAHVVDHIIMQCLTEMMAKAHQTGVPASDADYLSALRNI